MNIPFEEIMERLDKIESLLIKPQEISTKPYVNVDGAAKLLGISKVSVYRLVKNKSVPFCKIGGSIRFKLSDLTNFSFEVHAK